MSNYLIVNFDRMEYLRPEAFGEKSDLRSVLLSCEGVMTALTVLLADGNNRGGGDLRSDDEIIGTWAGNRIAIVDEAVTDPNLSAVGFETVPLQQQALTQGTDVSMPVLQVIAKTEGDYFLPATLNPQHILTPSAQRALSSRGRQLLLTAKGRNLPLTALEDVFAIFGVEAGLSPYQAKKQLQAGLTRTAELFSRAERWTVHSTEILYGLKPVRLSEYTDEMRPGEGVIGLKIVVSEANSPSEVKELSVRFISRGYEQSTTKQVFNCFFPGVDFEPPKALPVAPASLALTNNSEA